MAAGHYDTACPAIEESTNANIEYAANICPVMCEQMQKGHIGDTSGDTVGCRITKAKLAEEDPVTYCQEAGPLGVNGCAEPCDAFCALLYSACAVPEAVPFDNYAQCETMCGDLEYLSIDEGGSDLTTTTGANLNCWLYHLQVANDPNNPGAYNHCYHIDSPNHCI